MNRSAHVGAALVAAILFATAGCSTDGGSGSGTGGSGTSSGGTVGSGGSNGTGGAGTGAGGRAGTGGLSGTGGQIPTGAGGASASGGAPGLGGNGTGFAGTTGAGGSATGGTAGAGPGTGGLSGSGGSGGGAGLGSRVRTVQAFDTNWLFHYGDATGASAATFADTGWRSLNVPHDWSIEGPNPPANPFSQTAATTGRGAYVPSGIAWYRKHFTLPQSLSGQRVVHRVRRHHGEQRRLHQRRAPWPPPLRLRQLPIRHDRERPVRQRPTTSSRSKTDTTTQPAERFFAGAGIYRHVRLIATNPVHIAQYATFVTTPSPTTTAATVHVHDHGGEPADRLPEREPPGYRHRSGRSVRSAPVTATGQTIAAGASADFAFDVPVQNPKLWDLTTPEHVSTGHQRSGRRRRPSTTT